MSPGELWTFPADPSLSLSGGTRLVVSNAMYNATSQVITVPCIADASHLALVVTTEFGDIVADRVLQHPQAWLTDFVGTVADAELALVRRHLSFVLCEP